MFVCEKHNIIVSICSYYICTLIVLAFTKRFVSSTKLLSHSLHKVYHLLSPAVLLHNFTNNNNAEPTFLPPHSIIRLTSPLANCLPVILSVTLLNSHGHLVALRNSTSSSTPKSVKKVTPIRK